MRLMNKVTISSVSDTTSSLMTWQCRTWNSQRVRLQHCQLLAAGLRMVLHYNLKFHSNTEWFPRKSMKSTLNTAVRWKTFLWGWLLTQLVIPQPTLPHMISLSCAHTLPRGCGRILTIALSKISIHLSSFSNYAQSTYLTIMKMRYKKLKSQSRVFC